VSSEKAEGRQSAGMPRGDRMELGDDGLVTVRLPHSPMQMLMIHWVGSEAGRFLFHMDGRLNALKNLIKKSPIDMIEAFHPPPMGDLPINKALTAWNDKVIWVGFPGSIYSMGTEATREYTLNLIKEIGSGERLAIAMSTENLVSNENLITVSSILEKAELPLT
jgi:hypothetical protein